MSAEGTAKVYVIEGAQKAPYIDPGVSGKIAVLPSGEPRGNPNPDKCKGLPSPNG
jgi:hypothetical protein